MDDGVLQLTAPTGKTRSAETRLGLCRARYFYAGRAHPQFGDFAFAYRASLESGREGDAHPFDTGGLFYGKMNPTKGLPDYEREQVADQLAQQHRTQLADWRATFAHHLAKAFPRPNQYIREAPRPATLETTLPAMDSENQSLLDWRSWTWEIRLHAPTGVLQQLWRAACSPAAREALLSHVRRPGAKEDAFSRLAEMEDLIVDAAFAQKLEEALEW